MSDVWPYCSWVPATFYNHIFMLVTVHQLKRLANLQHTTNTVALIKLKSLWFSRNHFLDDLKSRRPRRTLHGVSQPLHRGTSLPWRFLTSPPPVWRPGAFPPCDREDSACVWPALVHIRPNVPDHAYPHCEQPSFFIFCVAKFGVTWKKFTFVRAPAAPVLQECVRRRTPRPLPPRHQNAPDVLMQRVEKTRMCWFLPVSRSSVL